jgi:hypothetical protein
LHPLPGPLTFFDSPAGCLFIPEKDLKWTMEASAPGHRVELQAESPSFVSKTCGYYRGNEYGQDGFFRGAFSSFPSRYGADDTV